MAEDSSHKDEKCSVQFDRDDMVRLAVDILESEKDFQFISVLGKGTYGDVFKMYDPERDEDIAAKIVTPDNISEKELSLWPKLHHRNIVPLLELLTLKPMTTTIFIMPLQRKNLHDVLCDQRFMMRPGCLNKVKEWMLEVLLALEYIRSKGFCHLDIKVDNVLISHKSTAMLCDFSFLNVTLTPLKRYDLGLPYIYRPPDACQTLGKEIFIDGGPYDMWGYGVMVVEILTHFVIASNVPDSKCWMQDVYPTLFNVLQEAHFAKYFSHTFPADNINEYDIKLALNFIHSFLVTNTFSRALPQDAMKHAFLNHGNLISTVIDVIWIHKKTDVALQKDKRPEISNVDSIGTHTTDAAHRNLMPELQRTYSETSEDVYLTLTDSDSEDSEISYIGPILTSSALPGEDDLDEASPDEKELSIPISSENCEELPLIGEETELFSEIKVDKTASQRSSGGFMSDEQPPVSETDIIQVESCAVPCNEDSLVINEVKTDGSSHLQKCIFNPSESKDLLETFSPKQSSSDPFLKSLSTESETLSDSDSITECEPGNQESKEFVPKELWDVLSSSSKDLTEESNSSQCKNDGIKNIPGLATSSGSEETQIEGTEVSISVEKQHTPNLKQLKHNSMDKETNQINHVACNDSETETSNSISKISPPAIKLETNETLLGSSLCDTVVKDSPDKTNTAPKDTIDTGKSTLQSDSLGVTQEQPQVNTGKSTLLIDSYGETQEQLQVNTGKSTLLLDSRGETQEQPQVNTGESTEVKWATGDCLSSFEEEPPMMEFKSISPDAESDVTSQAVQNVSPTDFDVSRDLRGLRKRLCELDKMFGELEKTLVCENCSLGSMKSDENVNSEYLNNTSLSHLREEDLNKRRLTEVMNIEESEDYVPQRPSFDTEHIGMPMNQSIHHTEPTGKSFARNSYSLNTKNQIEALPIELRSISIAESDSCKDGANITCGRGRKLKKWFRERCLDLERFAQKKPYNILK